MISSMLIILAFTFWKSSYSQPLIDFHNEVSPLYLSRVVDYSDLWSFIAIPTAHYIYNNPSKFNFNISHFEKSIRVLATILTTFAITATSLGPHPKIQPTSESALAQLSRTDKTLIELEKLAFAHGLRCVECDISQSTGEFRATHFTMKYSLNKSTDTIYIVFDIHIRTIMWFKEKEAIQEIKNLIATLESSIQTSKEHAKLIFLNYRN